MPPAYRASALRTTCVGHVFTPMRAARWGACIQDAHQDTRRSTAAKVLQGA